MIGFWIFMLIMELMIPFIMLGFGAFFSRHAPKEINNFVGYRTARSMKNRDTWEFAHHYCGRLWKTIGIMMTPATFLAMLFTFGKNIDAVALYGIILMAVQLVILIGSIFPVESALKRTFDGDGIRRS